MLRSTAIGAILATALFVADVAFANDYPHLPKHLKSPWSSNPTVERFANARALLKLFDRRSFHPNRVAETGIVPRLFVDRVPHDMHRLTVDEKTSLFIRILLPAVIKVNELVLTVRKRLHDLHDKQSRGSELSVAEKAWLKEIADDYKIAANPEVIETLLKRVDIVPVAMALAQGSDESGWGTSRLAKQANAFFGEHGPAPITGTFVTTASGKVKVASFADVFHAYAGYLHTINTGRAYSEIRRIRSEHRAQGTAMSGLRMINGLKFYSERGTDYIEDLKSIIRHHQLDAFNNAQLAPNEQARLLVYDGTR
jgi:Bax protein